jgi:DNA-directed RNA polymerase specialized sigma24 family protein
MVEGEIIDVIQSESQDRFEFLSNKLKGFILSHVIPFTRDRNVMRIEDAESLLNLCLYKLHTSLEKFIYDKTLSKKINERRFLKFFGENIYNALIDVQYKLNSIKKRVPKSPATLLSIEAMVTNDSDDCGFDIEDFRCCSIIDSLSLKEMCNTIRARLDDQEKSVFDLLCKCLTAEEISRKIGISTASVRYIMAKVQNRIELYKNKKKKRPRAGDAS